MTAENPEVESAHTTLVFGWVSFFQDLGSKMVVPILPLFLTEVLGAPPVAVGLSGGVADATPRVEPRWEKHGVRFIGQVHAGLGVGSTT